MHGRTAQGGCHCLSEIPVVEEAAVRARTDSRAPSPRGGDGVLGDRGHYGIQAGEYLSLS